MSAALRYLSHRPRSEAEVRVRLREKHPEPVVGKVVGLLKEQGLLDDEAFASAWRSSRANSRPRSAALIRRELLSRGVSQQVAEKAVEDLDEDEAAYNAAGRTADRLADAGYQVFRRKLWGYLNRRGFSQSITRRTVDRLWEERGGTHR